MCRNSCLLSTVRYRTTAVLLREAWERRHNHRVLKHFDGRPAYLAVGKDSKETLRTEGPATRVVARRQKAPLALSMSEDDACGEVLSSRPHYKLILLGIVRTDRCKHKRTELQVGILECQEPPALLRSTTYQDLCGRRHSEHLPPAEGW